MKPVRFLTFASFAVLTACAAPGPDNAPPLAMSTGPQCFRVNELRAFRTAPDGSVAIRTSGNRWFELRLTGICPTFAWVAEIGIRPRNTLWLCEGSSEKLIAPFPAGGDNCYIEDVRRIASETSQESTGAPVSF